MELGAGGHVTNGSTATAAASIAGGSDGILNNGKATVTNYGKISASDGAGIAFDNGAGGVIKNGSSADTTASITGTIWGIETGGTTTVANFGAITGTDEVGVQIGSGRVTNGATADAAPTAPASTQRRRSPAPPGASRPEAPPRSTISAPSPGPMRSVCKSAAAMSPMAPQRIPLPSSPARAGW